MDGVLIFVVIELMKVRLFIHLYILVLALHANRSENGVLFLFLVRSFNLKIGRFVIVVEGGSKILLISVLKVWALLSSLHRRLLLSDMELVALEGLRLVNFDLVHRDHFVAHRSDQDAACCDPFVVSAFWSLLDTLLDVVVALIGFEFAGSVVDQLLLQLSRGGGGDNLDLVECSLFFFLVVDVRRVGSLVGIMSLELLPFISR